MKKLLALVLALVLCIACFSGCGTKDGKAPDDATVITVWSTAAGAQAVWEEIVGEWNEREGKEKGIYIDWVTSTDNQRVDVAAQSGQLPHIFGGDSMRRAKLIKSGDVIAINELPGGEEFLEEYGLPGIEGDTVVDGKTYVIPLTVTTTALAYNKDLFKKAGIVDENGEAKPPTTFSEAKEAAKKITALGNGVYGFALPLKFGLYYTVDSPVKSYYDGLTPETSFAYTDLDNLTVDCSNYKEIYQWLFDMRKDGSLFPGAESLDNDTARAYFAQGNVGMIPAASWDVGVYTTQFIPECDWDICQYPAPDGRELYKHYNERGTSMSIGKKAALKNPEETMEVYKFIYSPETRAKLFERGINLFAKKDVLEIADRSKTHPVFFKFGELVDETKRYAKSETYAIEGDGWGSLFQQAWIGEITLDEAIRKNEEILTFSLRKAVEKGEYDVERQKNVRKYLAGDDSVDISKN